MCLRFIRTAGILGDTETAIVEGYWMAVSQSVNVSFAFPWPSQ